MIFKLIKGIGIAILGYIVCSILTGATTTSVIESYSLLPTYTVLYAIIVFVMCTEDKKGSGKNE
ncbi:MAG: hypothetical protein ACRCTE_06345 [Cellulosilyticaceae bacterium]